MRSLSRRNLLGVGTLLASGALAGCGTTRDTSGFGPVLDMFGGPEGRPGQPDYRAIYGGYDGEAHPVLPFDYTRVDPMFLRQVVRYETAARPGSIVVDPPNRFLYFVEPGGRATRYGVGVGREGFAWSGRARINMRRAWPDWIPPREMVARDPDIRAQLEPTPRGEGVPGGPRSPLGARALYLFGAQGGGDLGYRIHGTTEPETIGTNVSSGCVRMVNQDVIHLYSRAPAGTEVTVLG